MNATLQVSRDEGNALLLKIEGAIGFETVLKLRQEGGQAIADGTTRSVHVDLGQVGEANSVLFSLLLRWFSDCQSRGLAMEVGGLSAHMMDMARISGLDEVLPIVNVSA